MWGLKAWSIPAPCCFLLLAIGPSFKTGYCWRQLTSSTDLIVSMMDFNDSSSREIMKFKSCQNCQLRHFFLLGMTSSLSANVWKQLRGALLNCMHALRDVRLHLGLGPPHFSGHPVIWCARIGAIFNFWLTPRYHFCVSEMSQLKLFL